ncbi:MAG: LysR family transcriptional regulator [Roseobacter sp.]
MNVAWDDLRTVMMLVRHQSLAGAATALGVNYTTVARRIRRAENTLNQRLFDRLTDGYRPTDAGHIIAEQAEHMEANAHTIMRQLQGAETELSGTITITAPQLLIANFLAPVIAQFTKAHPLIELRVLATNDILDLKRREADLAIRISDTPGDALTGLRLLQQDRASFSNPVVADAIEADPTAMIHWIVNDANPTVPEGIDAKFPHNCIRFRSDDMVAMLGAAQAGLGVVRMPMFLGRSVPGLVQVPVLPPQTYTDVWIVGHPDVWPSQKLHVFRKHVVRHCKANRQLFVKTKNR